MTLDDEQDNWTLSQTTYAGQSHHLYSIPITL